VFSAGETGRMKPLSDSVVDAISGTFFVTFQKSPLLESTCTCIPAARQVLAGPLLMITSKLEVELNLMYVTGGRGHVGL
jgi:hypothetical protein